jgi:hypothetical protein
LETNVHGAAFLRKEQRLLREAIYSGETGDVDVVSNTGLGGSRQALVTTSLWSLPTSGGAKPLSGRAYERGS